jgi:hypothetical protein
VKVNVSAALLEGRQGCLVCESEWHDEQDVMKEPKE